jgi:hypothetical protein
VLQVQGREHAQVLSQLAAGGLWQLLAGGVVSRDEAQRAAV